MLKLYSYYCRFLSVAFLIIFFFNLDSAAQVAMGDNLGNHKATQVLDLNNKAIINAKGVVIGAASIAGNNVVLDINSATKAMLIPRIVSLDVLNAGGLIDGMMVYDQLTNHFYFRQNNTWVTFGSFALAAGQMLVGNNLSMAGPVTLNGDVTFDAALKSKIGDNKVKLSMLGTNVTQDINKVYATNISGKAELINKSDLLIPKYTTAARDSKYTTATPADNNTLIFNLTSRELQVYDAASTSWGPLGVASSDQLPVVTTLSPTVTQPDEVDITANIASSISTVLSRGVVYYTTAGATTKNFASSDMSGGLGSYSLKLSNLAAATLYFAKAYATNSAGTSYGNEVSFTTSAANVPAVSTVAVTDITGAGAVSGGIITSDKGAAVTARGVLWGTTSNLTLGGSGSSVVSGAGTGQFKSAIVDLLGGTTYHVRAYATNAQGTGYGNEISFSSAPVMVPELDLTLSVTKTAKAAKGGGTLINNGGAAISKMGLAWNTANVFPSTLTAKNSVTVANITSGAFTADIDSIKMNTFYYVWPFATNSAGTGYADPVTFKSNGIPVVISPFSVYSGIAGVEIMGSVVSEGGTVVKERGFVYGFFEDGLPVYGQANTVKVLSGTGGGDFRNIINGLIGGVQYYVRPFAINSLDSVAYGPERSFTTIANGSVNYPTPGTYQWTVPGGVTKIRLSLSGGKGGDNGTFKGGFGGVASATMVVAPGDILYLNVGGSGTAGTTAAPPVGGFNGGGTGGIQAGSNTAGSSGGGGTDIRVGNNDIGSRIIIAGGGGGASIAANGGNGGPQNGDNGSINASNSFNFANSYGRGAVGAVAGAGGTFTNGANNNTGVAGLVGVGGRGNAASTAYTDGGGGGGGGYYGGGGGAASGGGGGGSSYFSSSVTNPSVALSAGIAGAIKITW